MTDSSQRGQTRKTMLYRLVGDIHLTVHSAEAPSDQEWDGLLADYDACVEKMKGMLVFSLGGGPNARQRKRTRDFWSTRRLPRTAIITSSMVVRTMVTALNLFVGGLGQTFAPEAIHEAMQYLGVPSSEERSLLRAIDQLRRELGC